MMEASGISYRGAIPYAGARLGRSCHGGEKERQIVLLRNTLSRQGLQNHLLLLREKDNPYVSKSITPKKSSESPAHSPSLSGLHTGGEKHSHTPSATHIERQCSFLHPCFTRGTSSLHMSRYRSSHPTECSSSVQSSFVQAMLDSCKRPSSSSSTCVPRRVVVRQGGGGGGGGGRHAIVTVEKNRWWWLGDLLGCWVLPLPATATATAPAPASASATTTATTAADDRDEINHFETSESFCGGCQTSRRRSAGIGAARLRTSMRGVQTRGRVVYALDRGEDGESGAYTSMNTLRKEEQEGGVGRGKGGAGSRVFRAGQRRGEVRLPAAVLRVTAAEVLGERGEEILSSIGTAVASGINMVVLVEGKGGGDTASGFGGASLYNAACALRSLLRGRANLFVAERADIAAASGADGVLLSDQGLPTVVARRMMQGAATVSTAADSDVLPLVAQLVSTIDSGMKASADGADLLIIGKGVLVGSGSKREAGLVDILTELSRQVTVPVVAETTPVGRRLSSSDFEEGKSFIQAGADGLLLDVHSLLNRGGTSVEDVKAGVSKLLEALRAPSSANVWSKVDKLDVSNSLKSALSSGTSLQPSAAGEASSAGKSASPSEELLGSNPSVWLDDPASTGAIGLPRTLQKVMASRVSSAAAPTLSSLSSDQILDARAKVIIEEERVLLLNLYDLLKEASPEMSEISLLADALAQLDELFLLVIVGEFNSGKSSVINAILGERFLREGVVPTTNEITLLKHSSDGKEGRQERSERHPDGHVLRYLPADLLKQLNLVDTPGTNVILQRQQRLTEEFVPRADLVLFVLSADRPLTESEVSFLRYIRQWGKKVIFILNKADVLRSEVELEEVVRFIEDNAERLLGVEQVRVYPVSARKALKAKLAHTINNQLKRLALSQDPDWRSSGFQQLEHFIFDFLAGSGDAGQERLRLKLDTPLGIGAALTLACQRLLKEEKARVDADMAALKSVTHQVLRYCESMATDAVSQRERATSLIEEASERGERFVDRVLRLSNIQAMSKYILGTDALKRTSASSIAVAGGFEREVIGTCVSEIKALLKEQQSLMLVNNKRQVDKYVEFTRTRWEDVMPARGSEEGILPNSVEIEAQKILSGDKNGVEAAAPLGQTAMETIDGFDIRAATVVLESELKEVVLGTLSGTAAAGVSGYILTALLPTTLEDLLAVAICSLGGYISLLNLPLKRSEVKGKIRRAASALARQLDQAMQEEMNREMKGLKDAVEVVVAPYKAAVEADQSRVIDLTGRLENLDSQLQDLRRRVQSFAE